MTGGRAGLLFAFQTAAAHGPKWLFRGAEGGLTAADPGFRGRVASLSCLHQTCAQAGLIGPYQAWGTGLCSQTLGKSK